MTNGAEMFKGSLAAAEAARDTRAYSGFIAGLFEGVVRRSLFTSASIPAMSGDAKEFLDTLRLLLIEKVDPEAIDREGAIGEEVIEAFRAIGAFGIKIPRSYGGLGLSQSEYHTVATLLGSHDAATSVLLSAHNSIGVAEPVKLVGNREQQQRLLPRLARGEISGFALTEKSAGCDIWDLKTYAIPVHEGGVLVGYRLTGEKLYTTNAPREDHESGALHQNREAARQKSGGTSADRAKGQGPETGKRILDPGADGRGCHVACAETSPVSPEEGRGNRQGIETAGVTNPDL
ncbi:MAG: hypothetical protein E8D43_03610 [Nitrospira sp.]|nr:MAG: hypothetical protein E8D43_03610 [Nitrospira sp.]